MLLALIQFTRLVPYRYGVEAETTQTNKSIQMPSGASVHIIQISHSTRSTK